MRSRAISRKKQEFQEFFESPVERCAKPARAVVNELQVKHWTIDWQRRRFERITESHTKNKKSSSYLLIDFKRKKIARSITRLVTRQRGKAQKALNDSKHESKEHSIRGTLNTFLLGICSSYIGSLLFKLTEVVLPLTVLILSNHKA